MNRIGTRMIQTQRLRLRRIAMGDAQDMFENWASDPEVTRYLTWQPHANIEVTKSVISFWLSELERDDAFKWCIEYKPTGRAIGTIDVVGIDWRLQSVTMGYCLSRRYWDQGIMTEALAAVIDYLFLEVGVNRIEAFHHVDNPASGRVMEKCGMKPEGVKRQGAFDNGGNYCDIAIYAIVRSDRGL